MNKLKLKTFVKRVVEAINEENEFEQVAYYFKGGRHLILVNDGDHESLLAVYYLEKYHTMTIEVIEGDGEEHESIVKTFSQTIYRMLCESPFDVFLAVQSEGMDARSLKTSIKVPPLLRKLPTGDKTRNITSLLLAFGDTLKAKGGEGAFTFEGLSLFKTAIFPNYDLGTLCLITTDESGDKIEIRDFEHRSEVSTFIENEKREKERVHSFLEEEVKAALRFREGYSPYFDYKVPNIKHVESDEPIIQPIVKKVVHEDELQYEVSLSHIYQNKQFSRFDEHMKASIKKGIAKTLNIQTTFDSIIKGLKEIEDNTYVIKMNPFFFQFGDASYLLGCQGGNIIFRKCDSKYEKLYEVSDEQCQTFEKEVIEWFKKDHQKKRIRTLYQANKNSHSNRLIKAVCGETGKKRRIAIKEEFDVEERLGSYFKDKGLYHNPILRKMILRQPVTSLGDLNVRVSGYYVHLEEKEENKAIKREA